MFIKFHPCLQQLDGNGLILVSLLRKTSRLSHWDLKLSSKTQGIPGDI